MNTTVADIQTARERRRVIFEKVRQTNDLLDSTDDPEAFDVLRARRRRLFQAYQAARPAGVRGDVHPSRYRVLLEKTETAHQTQKP